MFTFAQFARSAAVGMPHGVQLTDWALQVGLATISAGVHRAGGSRAHPGSALDEALEVRAASIEGGASGEASAMGDPPPPPPLSGTPCLLPIALAHPLLPQHPLSFLLPLCALTLTKALSIGSRAAYKRDHNKVSSLSTAHSHNKGVRHCVPSFLAQAELGCLLELAELLLYCLGLCCSCVC